LGKKGRKKKAPRQVREDGTSPSSLGQGVFATSHKGKNTSTAGGCANVKMKGFRRKKHAVGLTAIRGAPELGFSKTRKEGRTA